MSGQTVHMKNAIPRSKTFTTWERIRNRKQVHWFMELFAEALGVFLYVYFGVGSTAGWVIGNLVKIPGLSTVFQIGFAYAFGILFAIGVAAPTSGGHFNPCVTIALVVFKGFPPLKALRYIVAQILGAYIACFVVYAQWKVLITEGEDILLAAGQATYAATQFTPNGPAGIFALYLLPGQTLGRVFMNEFVNCTVLAMIIWATLDPTNFLIPPSFGPVIISIAYAAAIWSFSTPGIALNAARDVGGRLMTITVWGTQAGGGSYAAIAALVNIPATLFAAFLYETFLTDSDRPMSPSHIDFINHHANHARHGHGGISGNRESETNDSSSSGEKRSIREYEHAVNTTSRV